MDLPSTGEHVLDALDFAEGGCEFSVWVVQAVNALTEEELGGRVKGESDARLEVASPCCESSK